VYDAVTNTYNPQPPGAQFSPGSNDDAVFGPAAQRADCWVNGDVTVRGMIVFAGYGGEIVLPSTRSLTIRGFQPGDDRGSNRLLLQDPNASIRAPIGNELGGHTFDGGTVRINSGARLHWDAGTLEKVGVIIDQGATATASTLAPKSQVDAWIVVDGALNWSSGDVRTVSTTGPAGSQLAIAQSGSFRMSAADAQWGTGAGIASEFQVLNYGTTTLNAGGTVTISGDYLTAGNTTLEVGILAIKGWAEQYAGTFSLLARTTVDVSAAKDTSLYLLGGYLVGDGTVQGNLSQSKQGADEFSGSTVAPGTPVDEDTRQPGTINVTGNLSMWTSGCTVSLFVDQSGGAGKLEVAGTARLKGTVVINWSYDYRPAVGTTVTFMTWGQREGAFDDMHATFPGWYVNGSPRRPYFSVIDGVSGTVLEET
jgi:formylmethanofuran dehydrogenase subunit C